MILYVYPMCVLGQKGIVSRIPKIITEYQNMNMFNGQQQTDCHVKKCFGMLFFDLVSLTKGFGSSFPFRQIALS